MAKFDYYFQKLAEMIQNMIPPEWNEFMKDLFSNNVLVTMSEQELQTACIKYALEALAIALLLWIGAKCRNKASKNQKNNYKTTVKKKKVAPKKWKTDGTYYDEEKKKWIEPDYK